MKQQLVELREEAKAVREETHSMKKLLLGVLAVVSMLTVSQPAKADPITIFDPSMRESLSLSCPANCASVGLALDPLSGMTTVRYVFNSTIPAVVVGDVLIREFGSSTIGDLIRLENIGGAAVAFIFSNDHGSPADVGLPAFLSNTVTISELSNGFTDDGHGNPGLWSPSVGQPGYCTSCTTGQPGYNLQSVDVPEPASLALLVTGLAGLVGITRRRHGRK